MATSDRLLMSAPFRGVRGLSLQSRFSVSVLVRYGAQRTQDVQVTDNTHEFRGP